MIHAQAEFVETEEHCREPRDPGKLWHRLFGLLGERVSESGCLCRRGKTAASGATLSVWMRPGVRVLRLWVGGWSKLLTSNRLRAMRASGIVCLDAPRAAPRPAGKPRLR